MCDGAARPRIKGAGPPSLSRPSPAAIAVVIINTYSFYANFNVLFLSPPEQASLLGLARRAPNSELQQNSAVVNHHDNGEMEKRKRTETEEGFLRKAWW